MSHDRGWRAACGMTIWILRFHFNTREIARGVTAMVVGSGALLGIGGLRIAWLRRSLGRLWLRREKVSYRLDKLWPSACLAMIGLFDDDDLRHRGHRALQGQHALQSRIVGTNDSDRRYYLAHALAAYDEKRIGLIAQLTGTREQQKRVSDPQLAQFKAEALQLRAKVESMPDLKSPELLADDINPEGVRDPRCWEGARVFTTGRFDRPTQTPAPHLNYFRDEKSGGRSESAKSG